MRQIEYRLGQTGRLDDTSDLDGALVLDEFANCAEEGWGELLPQQNQPYGLERPSRYIFKK